MQLSPIDRNGSCSDSKWPQLQRNAHCDTVHASDIGFPFFVGVKSAGFIRTENSSCTTLSGYVSDPMSTMRYCSSFSSGGSFEDSN